MGFAEPVIYLAKKTWRFSKGRRHKIILYIFLFLIAHAINFLEPLIVAKLVNIIQEQGINSGNLSVILIYISLFLALTFGFWLFHGPARVLERNNAFLVRANYRKYLLDGVMDLDPEWHTNHHSGDTIDKIDKGTKALYRFSAGTFEIIEAITRFAGSYVALIYFNLHSAYIVLFFVILAMQIVMRFDNKLLMANYRRLNWADNAIKAKIFDTISNITTVIILRVEKLLSKAIWKKIMKPLGLYCKTTNISEIKWFLTSLCASLMMVFVLGTYVYTTYISGTVLLIGNFFALFEYVRRINGLFFRFAYKYSDIVEQRADVDNAEEIAEIFEYKKKSRQLDMGRWKELDINNLTFSYEGKEGDLHLKDVNLLIKKRQKIALIGESGSGKTTFLKLIRGLYRPQKADIFLGGDLLHNYFEAISEHIALIPQDPEIFATTIKENITLGLPLADKKLKKYIDLAKFTDVIKKLPKGLKSSVVEKGVNLSGGEKQRLALARGLFACKGKEIILLDEPTSSVDSKNEIEIYQNIFKKYKNKTIISSIHRLHLLHLFDYIYVFKKGKIVACGTFHQLLSRDTQFKKLWEKYKSVS